MFCTRCGVQLEERDHFCFECGAVTGRGPAPVQARRLTRKVSERKIAGVCAGVAEYLDADPTLVRVMWVLLSLGLPPAGLLGYIVAWMIVPADPAPVFYAAPAAEV